MSRSYKKKPVFKDTDSRKTPKRYKGKTLAARAVRRSIVPSGKGGYKKVYCSWDIHEYAFYRTEEEFRKDWENGDEYLHRKFKAYKQARRYWLKFYRNK